MSFEALANELLFDVFDYLTTAEQFDAFHNLSDRFNALLLEHLRIHGRFDFQSMSQTNFQLVSQAYLPQLTRHVVSIHLCDDSDCLDQTNLFLGCGYQFRQFTHLKSLSFSYIYSEDIIGSIVSELHHLDHLTHLQLKQCQVDHELVSNEWIFDQIWSLKRLTHFRFERKVYLWNPFFIASKLISTSIKYLHLEGFMYNATELHRLLENTIQLQYLNIKLEHNYEQQEIPSMIYSMRKLHISAQYSPYVTCHLLQHMPNLTDLTLDLAYLVVDGNQLEEMITKGLPNLKAFQLKMKFHRRCRYAVDDEVNQLLESFRGPFWTVKHQWYVQCHWHTPKQFLKAHLYTLPSKLDAFVINADMHFRSTCPNNELQWSYDHVRKLAWQDSQNDCIRFEHVDQLRLLAPIKDCLWSMVPNLHRLRSLNVRLSNNVNEDAELENLLRHASNLHSLTLEDDAFPDEYLFRLQSSSIRQLDLRDFRRFDAEQCRALALSPLGTRCKVLLVAVKQRTDVFTLVNEMNNLRVLQVRCEDDPWTHRNDDDDHGRGDELVEFLTNSLPQNCVIRRGKSNSYAHVKLWIR